MTSNTAAAAKTIRTALKTKGITSRQVSVRSDLYSMGSTIRIAIKDPSVSFTLVQEIAQAHERVSRCEITGEILSGGNRFIDVDFDDGALSSFFAAVEAEVEAKGEYRREGIVIRPTHNDPGYFDVVAGDWQGTCWHVHHAARQVAQRCGVDHVEVTPPAPPAAPVLTLVHSVDKVDDVTARSARLDDAMRALAEARAALETAIEEARAAMSEAGL